jgi:hypothetical protein
MPITQVWPIEGVALGSPVAGSLAAYVRSFYNANYTEGRCYPTLAAGKTVVSGINWALSAAFAALVPINTIHVPYHVSTIVIETCTTDGVYELALYHGVANTLMATLRFSVIGGFFGNSVFLSPSILLAAEEQTDMKLAISGGVAGTITCSIIYRVLAP